MTRPSKDLQTLFLTDKDLAARWSVHRLTPWAWVKAGKLPKPIKMNGSTRWKLADIEAWEAKQESMA
jgi:predicted DNA-binding transcriptional regulator AlpA